MKVDQTNRKLKKRSYSKIQLKRPTFIESSKTRRNHQNPSKRSRKPEKFHFTTSTKKILGFSSQNQKVFEIKASNSINLRLFSSIVQIDHHVYILGGCSFADPVSNEIIKLDLNREQ